MIFNVHILYIFVNFPLILSHSIHGIYFVYLLLVHRNKIDLGILSLYFEILLNLIGQKEFCRFQEIIYINDCIISK
jgi:hypothetical protein